ncbi:flavin monoamine oxidase family protein [Pacificoceanicola onchidii]|uniref:flavin monoamine oxidase family protein n=1 Tax=Pacificoceanicola onchidii TaxID=2562685 RepID=UPI0010A2B5BF|nr:NAD(P)/FAD-dependent oxidoreductase [Pacificoceanicola onchidii]
MKTLIIGGGLSGLYLAERLEAQGRAYHVLEARDRFGGRIMTERAGQGVFDMGPAWFWPGQPRIAALINRLGLRKFDQYAAGDLSFEDENGRVQRGYGFASMEGSWRLVGGLTGLTEALATRVPEAKRSLNAPVVRLERSGGRCRATLQDGSVVEADRIVLAMPPRIAAGLAFAPALPAGATQAMANVPTWMAGQAKAVAVYDSPFWREAGLSGDAMSRRGPMVEIHDASPAEQGPYALFGFIGVPPAARADTDRLKQAVQHQLVRLFGEAAAEPRALFVKDWAADPFTATSADAAPQYSHPAYGLPKAMQDLWDGNLIFAGTEVGQDFGGYIEGALEAAEAALLRLDEEAPAGL